MAQEAFNVVYMDDNKMDPDLEKLLKENKLYEALHQKLNDFNITLNDLRNIKTNEFGELCDQMNLTMIEKAKCRTLMDLIHKNSYNQGETDIQLKGFLDKHKLAHLYRVLQCEKISYESLEFLSTVDIDNLCDANNIKIGVKIDFKKAVDQHQIEILKEKYSTPGNPVEKIERKDDRKFDDEVQVMLLGNTAVGKSALLARFLFNNFNYDMVSTIGIDCGFAYKRLSNNKVMKMTIWDTAGQERYRSIPRSYYQRADAFIVCYGVDSRASFDACSEWINDIIQYGQNENPVVMLVGCKGELKVRKHKKNKKRGISREVNINDLREMARSDPWRKFNTQYGECSAATGENVESIFMTLAELIARQRIPQAIPQAIPRRRRNQNVRIVPVADNHDQSNCCGKVSETIGNLFGQ